jgi:phytoene dehydrogenase-like protein
MSNSEVDVVVIGAGHNGLVAACYMARAGLQVMVLEASPTVGGMTGTLSVIPEAPGHKINTGAVDVVFLRATRIPTELELERFGFQQIEVDPPLAYLADDGASLAFWRNPARTAEEIRSFSPSDAEAFLRLSRTLDAALDVALPVMGTNPRRPEGRALARLVKAAGRHWGALKDLSSLFVSSTSEFVDERFRHPIVRDALIATASTVTPPLEDGGAIPLLFLAFLHRVGASRLVGGMQALPDALTRALEAMGGSIQCGTEVEEILVSNGRAAGVRVHGGKEIRARQAVLAACDPRMALARLLPDGTGNAAVDARVRHLPAHARGGAWFKVDLALSGGLRLGRHQARRRDGVDLKLPACVIGTADDAITNWADSATGHFPSRPLMYTVVPTAVDPTQAPPDQDTLYLWACPVPARPAEPWTSLSDHAAKVVVDRASEFYDGLGELEIGRSVESPPDAERRLRVPGGCLMHVDLTTFRVGPLRPAIGLSGYRTPVDGLYLGAAGSHPGGGVFGLPGRLAAKEILRTTRRRAEVGEGGGCE